jgi:hypothetical protein
MEGIGCKEIVVSTGKLIRNLEITMDGSGENF